jgi:hypothetical protein
VKSKYGRLANDDVDIAHPLLNGSLQQFVDENGCQGMAPERDEKMQPLLLQLGLPPKNAVENDQHAHRTARHGPLTRLDCRRLGDHK